MLNIVPLTLIWASYAFSRLTQLSSRRALSREITASPRAFSTRSRYTSTLSPTLSVIERSGPANSFNATRPSVFKPISMIATSFSMPTTVPRITEPSARSFVVNDSSKRDAKSSNAKSLDAGEAAFAADNI